MNQQSRHLSQTYVFTSTISKVVQHCTQGVPCTRDRCLDWEGQPSRRLPTQGCSPSAQLVSSHWLQRSIGNHCGQSCKAEWVLRPLSIIFSRLRYQLRHKFRFSTRLQGSWRCSDHLTQNSGLQSKYQNPSDSKFGRLCHTHREQESQWYQGIYRRTKERGRVGHLAQTSRPKTLRSAIQCSNIRRRQLWRRSLSSHLLRSTDLQLSEWKRLLMSLRKCFLLSPLSSSRDIIRLY